MALGLAFEKALYVVHERVLFVFTELEDAPLPHTRFGRLCHARRCCARSAVCVAALLFSLLITILALSVSHVGQPGCFGAVTAAAAAAWGINGTPASREAFFRGDDVFRIMLDPSGSASSARAVLWGGALNTSSGAQVLLAQWPVPPSSGGGTPPTPLVSSSLDYIFAPAAPLVLLEAGGYTGAALSSAAATATAAGTDVGAPPLTAQHSFRRIDLTLPLFCRSSEGPLSGGPSGSDALFFVTGLLSYDTVIINELQWSFPSASGYVYSLSTGEVWNWGPVRAMVSSLMGPLSPTRTSGGLESFLSRLSFTIDAALLFFLLSSFTAILLRVLLTSGVAVAYPVARCLVVACHRRRDSWAASLALLEVDRALNAAYPWLGAHVAYARRMATVAALEREAGIAENAAQAAPGAGGEGLGTRAQALVGAPGGGGGGVEGGGEEGGNGAAGDGVLGAPERRPGGGGGRGAGAAAPPPAVGTGGGEAGGAVPGRGAAPEAAALAQPPPFAGAAAADAGGGAVAPLAPPPPAPTGAGAWSFIAAHAQSALVLFLSLQISSLTLSSASILGGKSFPQGLPSDVWAIFFFAEGASLIFARTERTLYVFPRVFALSYALWALYIVATPYGFFDEATFAWALSVALALAGCVLFFEVPALRAHKIHYWRPRAMLSRVPAPQPVAPAAGMLPPLWSVFMPLNVYLPEVPPPVWEDEEAGAGAYQVPVPPRPGGEAVVIVEEGAPGA